VSREQRFALATVNFSIAVGTRVPRDVGSTASAGSRCDLSGVAGYEFRPRQGRYRGSIRATSRSWLSSRRKIPTLD